MASIPDRPRRWYHRLSCRISLRRLIVLVLVIAAGMGWYLNRARDQQRRVLAIRAAGGRVGYKWIIGGGTVFGDQIPTRWARLIDTVGLDCLANVRWVSLGYMISGSSRIPKNKIDDALMNELGGLSHLDSLTFLADSDTITDAGLAQIGRLRELKKFDLSLNKGKKYDLSFLAQLCSLQEIDFGNCAGDENLAAIAGLTMLKQLSIYSSKIDGPRVTDAGLVHLAALTHLESLYLNETHIKGSGLVHLERMTELKLLSLASTDIADTGLAHLQAIPGLQSLDVSLTKVNDVGLAGLAGHPGLEVLRLWQSDVGDAGVKHLVTCPRLKQLYLMDTKLTDIGLARLAGMPSLTYLGVNRTPTTPAGVAQATRPGLRIDR